MKAATRLEDERDKRIDASIEIRVWMRRHFIRPIDVARELDVTPSAITHFLNGRPRSKSRKIWDLFVAKGCPEHLLKQLWGRV